MRTYKKLILLIFIFIFWGCTSVRVSQDYLPETEFLDLKTYRWQSDKQKPSGNKRIDSPLLDKRIRAAIDRSLEERGYRRVDDGDPDFIVSYAYSIRSKIESRDSGSSVGFGFGRYGRYGGIGINTGNEVRQYDQATLLIDLIKPQNGDLIWRGNGTRRVGEHSTPDETTEMVNEMVSKILNQFPPLPS